VILGITGDLPYNRRFGFDNCIHGYSDMRIIEKLLLAAAIAFSMVGANAQDSGQKTLVVYGASGPIGGNIVSEALDRGHRVIGVSRDPSKFSIQNENFAGVQGDITDRASVEETTRDVDAVVVALSGNAAGNAPEQSTHAIAAATLVAALTDVEGAPRVIQVGGATTMFETEEGILANLPFPAEEGTPAYGMFLGHLVALTTYRDSDIDWTVVTPPLHIIGWKEGDNTRTGTYRIETDKLVEDADGENSISMADLSVAVVDEAEKGDHVRKRFTVGY
jgi:putative NADH-flavin reductase